MPETRLELSWVIVILVSFAFGFTCGKGEASMPVFCIFMAAWLLSVGWGASEIRRNPR